MKSGKRFLLVTLLIMVVTAIFAFTACTEPGGSTPSNPDGDTGSGVYYLSVYDNGTFITYSSESDIPASNKFTKSTQNENQYTLSVRLEEGAKIKVGKIGSTDMMGGDELFTTRENITNGDNNALVIVDTGTYVFTVNTAFNTISYTYTADGADTSEVDEVIIDDGPTITLYYDAQSIQLSATVYFKDSTDTSEGIEWASSNENVATVTGGLLTPVTAGSTLIIASYDGVESDPITVNVNGKASLDITSPYSLKPEQSVRITASLLGGATASSWNCSDNNGTYVDWEEDEQTLAEDIVVTGVAPGNVTVTFYYVERQGASPKPLTCSITVSTPVEDITLAATMSVAVSGTQNLVVGFLPADATNKNYTYDIAQTGTIISVVRDGTTLKVTGEAEGTATISVNSEDGNFNKSCIVSVVDASDEFANEIDPGALNIDLNGTGALTVSGNAISTVSWESSDSAVVSVTAGTDTQTATVTGKGYGTATITANIMFASGQSATKTRKVVVSPEQMWVYGAFSDASWVGSYSGTSKYNLTKSSDGSSFSAILAHFPAGVDFRIAHNGFNYVGIGWGNISSKSEEKQYASQGSYDGSNRVYNVTVSKLGTYVITVDFTGTEPVLKITNNYIDAIGIAVAAQGDTTLTSGGETDEVVIKMTVNPTDADYEDIVWSANTPGLVTIQWNEDKDELTVTALDNLTDGGDVIITCTLKSAYGSEYDKSASVTVTVVEKGGSNTPVTDINFVSDAEYTYDINGESTWSLTVKATVNEDATNKGVTYTAGEDYGTAIQIATGSDGDAIITATKIGTYKIVATANANAEKFEEVLVTFYSSNFFLSGGVNGWGVSTGNTTVGTNYENFTFTSNAAHTVFTLDDVAMTTGNLSFAIQYCGTDTWNPLLKAGATYSGLTYDDNNCSVSSAGLYKFVINMETTTTTITATRKDAVPTYTAKLMKEGVADAVATSGNSSVSNNRYVMILEATAAADDVYTVKVGDAQTTISSINGATDGSTTYFTLSDSKLTCVTAGKYRLTATYNCSNNSCIISIEKLEDAWKTTTQVTLSAYSTQNDTTAPDSTTYYNSGSGIYKMYFSYNVQPSDEFNFSLVIGTNWNNLQPWIVSGILTNNATSIFTHSNGDKFKGTAAGGTAYFEVVFTVSDTTVTFTSVRASTTELTFSE